MSQPSFDPMEYIWQRLPKNKDGKTVRYLLGDLAYLYHHGFVDTLRYTYKQWEAAFIPFKQQDNTYILDKTAFLSLRLFRYNGPSHAEFDPAKLRVGPWADDELIHLYNKSIKPSSTISRDIFLTAVGALKKQGSVNENGDLVVDDKVKKQLKYLLEKFPSPRRRLEKEVLRLRQERDAKLSGHQKNRDKTNFIIGKSQTEEQFESFKKFEASQNTSATEKKTGKTTGETLDIKSLRKPGGKLMG